MHNLSYIIKEDGYVIYKDGKLWITQFEPYIPNPNLSYEENAIKHIEELNTPNEPNMDIENKISILIEQNDQQEEIIASLTYDLMMLQEPMALAKLDNNHSPKYTLIKSWFNKGYWNEDMLLDAVEKHYITEEEMNEILK